MRRFTICLALAAALQVLALPASAQQEPRPRAERAERGRTRVAELEQRITALERQLAAVQAELAAAKPGREAGATGSEVKVFALRNADAAGLTKLLTHLLGEDGQTRLVADERTNSVIAIGSGEQLLAVEALLVRLDEPVAPGAAGELRQSLRQHAGAQAAELKARLAQAEAEVRKRQEQLDFTERMLEKGYVTNLQAEAERAALDAARAVLEQVRLGLEAVAQPATTTVPAPE